MHLHAVEIIPAFPGTVQENHQRPFRIRLFLVALGQIQQVANGLFFAAGNCDGFLCLHGSAQGEASGSQQ